MKRITISSLLKIILERKQRERKKNKKILRTICSFYFLFFSTIECISTVETLIKVRIKFWRGFSGRAERKLRVSDRASGRRARFKGQRDVTEWTGARRWTGVRVWINYEDSDTKPARWVDQDSGPLYFWTWPHPLSVDLLFPLLFFFLSRAQLFSLNFPGKYVHAHVYPFSRFEGSRKYSCIPVPRMKKSFLGAAKYQFSTGLLLRRKIRLFALNIWCRGNREFRR